MPSSWRPLRQITGQRHHSSQICGFGTRFVQSSSAPCVRSSNYKTSSNPERFQLIQNFLSLVDCLIFLLISEASSNQALEVYNPYTVFCTLGFSVYTLLAGLARSVPVIVARDDYPCVEGVLVVAARGSEHYWTNPTQLNPNYTHIGGMQDLGDEIAQAVGKGSHFRAVCSTRRSDNHNAT